MNTKLPNRFVVTQSATKSLEKMFARAFRSVRVACGVAQDGLEPVVSRVYVSKLENGKSSPSLAKVDELAHALGLHPLTILALSYSERPTDVELQRLFGTVLRQVNQLGIKRFSDETLPPGTKPPQTDSVRRKN